MKAWQVTELGESIIQKLVAAGVTTVEALADMTPEQLEEIPGIGEKTLEKISIAVRHYFGHFEEGEEGAPAAEPTEAAVDGETETAVPEAVADTEDAEAENAQETLEEIGQVEAAAAEEQLEAADAEPETDASAETDDNSMTAAEQAVENVPAADEKTENEGGA